MIEVLDHEIKMPAVLQMRPYQQRWIDDNTHFKCAVKSARIGYSFATAYRRVEMSMRIPGRTTTVLSASKAQSVEFVETASKLCQLMGGTAQMVANEDFVDAIGRIEAIQSKITFPNGSRIIALPANPRTARGYPGDAVLDEFAHHEDSYSIFAAVFRQVALGNSLEVLSTPNGEQGKFYDIARNLGLEMGVAPAQLPVKKDGWSGHWVDVYRAVAEGCPINIEEMKIGLNDDDTWNQEFCCMFLKATGAWLTLDLIAACEEPTLDAVLAHLDPGSPTTALADVAQRIAANARGPLSAGIDVGRDLFALYCTSSSEAAVLVSISPLSVTMTPGATQQFTATVTNSSNSSVSWSVDDVSGGNATVGTIDSTGLYSAPTSAGTHTITATSVVDTTASGTAAVTINDTGSDDGGYTVTED